MSGRPSNCKFLNLIKKKLLMRAFYMLAHHGLHAIQVAHEGQCNGKNLASTVALGATHRLFSSGMTRAHREGPVGLRWKFLSFFFLCFLSHFLEKHA
jgi:hypothetical protein